MPRQKSFYVVLYHNDFSPSNEQHERVLAYTLWQPTYALGGTARWLQFSMD